MYKAETIEKLFNKKRVIDCFPSASRLQRLGTQNFFETTNNRYKTFEELIHACEKYPPLQIAYRINFKDQSLLMLRPIVFRFQFTMLSELDRLLDHINCTDVDLSYRHVCIFSKFSNKLAFDFPHIAEVAMRQTPTDMARVMETAGKQLNRIFNNTNSASSRSSSAVAAATAIPTTT